VSNGVGVAAGVVGDLLWLRAGGSGWLLERWVVPPAGGVRGALSAGTAVQRGPGPRSGGVGLPDALLCGESEHGEAGEVDGGGEQGEVG